MENEKKVMTDEELDQYIERLIEEGIATDAEIDLVCRINGWREDILNDILYVRTGYRDWNTYKVSELSEMETESLIIKEIEEDGDEEC